MLVGHESLRCDLAYYGRRSNLISYHGECGAGSGSWCGVTDALNQDPMQRQPRTQHAPTQIKVCAVVIKQLKCEQVCSASAVRRFMP